MRSRVRTEGLPAARWWNNSGQASTVPGGDSGPHEGRLLLDLVPDLPEAQVREGPAEARGIVPLPVGEPRRQDPGRIRVAEELPGQRRLAAMSIRQRIELLDQCLAGVAAAAPEWADAVCHKRDSRCWKSRGRAAAQVSDSDPVRGDDSADLASAFEDS